MGSEKMRMSRVPTPIILKERLVRVRSRIRVRVGVGVRVRVRVRIRVRVRVRAPLDHVLLLIGREVLEVLVGVSVRVRG
jgi:hypothetical protein